jgi:hypothetical protein
MRSSLLVIHQGQPAPFAFSDRDASADRVFDTAALRGHARAELDHARLLERVGLDLRLPVRSTTNRDPRSQHQRRHPSEAVVTENGGKREWGR